MLEPSGNGFGECGQECESIKALSEYLGHHDPGFTLRICTHLMPSRETRTRAAVDTVWAASVADNGPETAQES
nr:integrase [Streptomyces sp. NBC_00830]